MRAALLAAGLAGLASFASAQVGHKVAMCVNEQRQQVPCDQASGPAPGADAPDLSPGAADLMNGAAGAFGSMLGSGLVNQVAPPAHTYGTMRRAALNAHDADDARDPSVSAGVGAAQSILSEDDEDAPPPPNPAPQPRPRRPSPCPDDPGVVCLAAGGSVVDMAELGEEELGPFADAPNERPAQPPAAATETKPASATDQALGAIRSAWDSLAQTVSTADWARSTTDLLRQIPEDLKGASEKFGNGATAVAVIDAGVHIHDGENAKPAGELGSVIAASVPGGGAVAVGAQACGFVATCTNAALKTVNGVVNAPIQPVADLAKGIAVSGDLVEERSLREGVSREQARREQQAEIQANADRMKANGTKQINGLLCGFMGSGEGDCK